MVLGEVPRVGFVAPFDLAGVGLQILREYVLGPERFDFAFRTYIRRWAFKSPQPADFFRTMADIEQSLPGNIAAIQVPIRPCNCGSTWLTAEVTTRLPTAIPSEGSAAAAAAVGAPWSCL
mgnify:CR=1 FL=1